MRSIQSGNARSRQGATRQTDSSERLPTRARAVIKAAGNRTNRGPIHRGSFVQTGATPVAATSNPARDAMIDSQLKPCGVTTPRLNAAFHAVAREDFVPENRRSLAYVDTAHPLGNGRELMPPLSLGYLLEHAGLTPQDKVLIVGANTGYSAAVVARIAAHVTALESEAGLAAHARALLAGSPHVEVVEGPLDAGWPQGAPYSFILIDGAMEVELPDALIAQLGEFGRVAAIVFGEDGIPRASIGRASSGILRFDPFADASAAVLPPFRKTSTFRF